MPEFPLHYQSALDVAEKIHSGETSSVEVTHHMLQRIKSLDQALKAFVTVTEEVALRQAEAADEEIRSGKIRSPLHGIPVGIKDLLDTAGITTTYGMAIYRDHKPDRDATVVARLKEAGTVMLGKLKLTEGAYALHHPDVELPVNPWNADCWTGVSSSGSGVATAAGLFFAAIGSDTGGSIRFPSAANGLAGLKPTWGRVSRAGALPLGHTLDHMGPMTRTVGDTAAMLSIIAGRDERDPTSSHLPVPDYPAATGADIRGLRIGVDRQYCSDGIDPELTAAIEQVLDVLSDLGCTVDEVKIPWQDMARGWPVTCSIEAAWAHRHTWPARKSEYGSLGEFLEFGASLPASSYLQQELNRRRFKAELNGIFHRVDVVVCPSMFAGAVSKEGSDEARRAGQDPDRTLRFTAPFDFSGNPTLSLPWRKGRRGVPLSVQLVARDFEEDTLISAGYSLEQAGGYYLEHPDI